MEDFRHIENLLGMKREALKRFDDHMARSIMTSNQPDNNVCGILREEIEYLTDKIIHYTKSISLDDAFLTNRLRNVVNENPEHYLKMMDIKDVEKYLRKRKLDSIKKTV